MQQRVLGQPDGERLLTDLRHIAQALHEAALEGQLGLTALLAWLRRRREEASREGGQERSRRLETDAAAVQVITVHTSKGLEFPVVMVPFAWDLFARDDPATAVFHDEHDHRVRDVGGPGSPDWAAHAREHKQEEDGRRAAPDVRRSDPRAVAPAAVVGADVEHVALAAATAAAARRPAGRRAAVDQRARGRGGVGGVPRRGRWRVAAGSPSRW